MVYKDHLDVQLDFCKNIHIDVESKPRGLQFVVSGVYSSSHTNRFKKWIGKIRVNVYV